MKLIKLGLAVTLASILLFGPAPHSSAASTTIKSPVLLQINEYNVLYTYPKQPYMDSQQRLMVPLRAVSELLGASVAYNAELKQATIKKNGKEIILTGNSNKVIVDGEVKSMDTVPIVYKQSFVVPIRVLLEYMNLKGTLNSETGILQVEDEAINEFPMIQGSREWDTPAVKIANQTGILATEFELTLNDFNKNQLQKGRLHVTAKNNSGDTIPKGKEDLHIMLIYNKTYQVEVDYPTTGQRPRPALKPGQVFEQNKDFVGANYGDYLKYVLAVGRILK